MFLSKKNAEYLNRPKKGKKAPHRVLPGWGDDQQEESKQDFKQYQTTTTKVQQTNLLGEVQEKITVTTKEHKQSNKKTLYNWDELNDMNTIQCQKRLVESIVEPVGVKVKPTENLLTQFVKESKSMDPIIVGSLLLSKLQANYPFLVKAKSLYTIEHLSKKNQSYLSYFKSQLGQIQSFPEPEDNVDNYRKIMKSVMNVIGVAAEKTETPTESQSIEFVDPGYNDAPQIQGILQNNGKKKNLVGPGSKKFISPKDIQKTEKVEQKKQDIFDIFIGSSTTTTTTTTTTNNGKSGLEEFTLL